MDKEEDEYSMYTYTETNIHICFHVGVNAHNLNTFYTINILCPNTHAFTITPYDIKYMFYIKRSKMCRQ